MAWGLAFRGSSVHCGATVPHRPHRVGTYRTVRWGVLDRFCLGSPDAAGYEGSNGIAWHLWGREYLLYQGSSEVPSYLWERDEIVWH